MPSLRLCLLAALALLPAAHANAQPVPDPAATARAVWFERQIAALHRLGYAQTEPDPGSEAPPQGETPDQLYERCAALLATNGDTAGARGSSAPCGAPTTRTGRAHESPARRP